MLVALFASCGCLLFVRSIWFLVGKCWLDCGCLVSLYFAFLCLSYVSLLLCFAVLLGLVFVSPCDLPCQYTPSVLV